MIWYAVTLFVGFVLGFFLAALLSASARGRMQHPDEISAVSDARESATATEDVAELPSPPKTTFGGGRGASVDPGSQGSEDPDATESESKRRAEG